VQVKGFSWNKPKRKTANGNYVLIKDLYTGIKDDIIIIVYVPRSPEPFEFFIAKRGLLQDAQPEITVKPKTSEPYQPFAAGICFRNFERFQDRWDLLPEPRPILLQDEKIRGQGLGAGRLLLGETAT
jgi:hypothetical protein